MGAIVVKYRFQTMAVYSLYASLLSTGVQAEEYTSSALYNFAAELKSAENDEAKKIYQELLIKAKDEIFPAKPQESRFAQELKKEQNQKALLEFIEKASLIPMQSETFSRQLSEKLTAEFNEKDPSETVLDGKEHVTSLNNSDPKNPFEVVVKVKKPEDKEQLSLDFSLNLTEDSLRQKASNPQVKSLIDQFGSAAEVVKAYKELNLKSSEVVVAMQNADVPGAVSEGVKNANKDVFSTRSSTLRKEINTKKEEADKKVRYAQELVNSDSAPGSVSSPLQKRIKVAKYIMDPKNNAEGKEPCDLLIASLGGWASLSKADKEECEEFNPSKKGVAKNGEGTKAKSALSDLFDDKGHGAQPGANEQKSETELAADLEKSKLNAQVQGMQAAAASQFANLMQSCVGLYQQQQALAPFKALESQVKPLTEALYTKAPSCKSMGLLLPVINGGIGDYELEAKAAIRGPDAEFQSLKTYEEVKRKDRNLQDEKECLQRVASYSAIGIDMMLTGMGPLGPMAEQMQMDPSVRGLDSKLSQLRRFNDAARAAIAEIEKAQVDLNLRIEQLQVDAQSKFFGGRGSRLNRVPTTGVSTGGVPRSNINGARNQSSVPGGLPTNVRSSGPATQVGPPGSRR